MSDKPVPRIATLAIGTPDLVMTQEEAFEKVFAARFATVPTAERIFRNSGIRKRHFYCNPSEWTGKESTAERMRHWAEGSLLLGRRAIGAALEGVDRTTIGSTVTASCTGCQAPSPDMLLAAEFGLSERLRRTFIGHMGCYGAFNTIKVALDALAARPDESVLINCTEITSAHQRTEATVEQVVCNALFADASAASVLTMSNSLPGPQILHTHTETLYHTSDLMGWAVEDDGFRMHLSPRVPLILRDAAPGFTDRLLAPLGMTAGDVGQWGIHAGGPRIIEAVVGALGLRAEQYQASTDVLAEYGNCSSPTVLIILHRLLNEYQPPPGSASVLMAFGPGLTMEAMVLRH